MSLVVNLAVIAEGAAPDARGNLTLIAANPQALVADQLPAQFAPTFFVVIEEDEKGDQHPIIVPGRQISLKVEATGPDGEVVFVSQYQQPVMPTSHPTLPPRVQALAQVPFEAAKAGEYVMSARIAITCAAEGHDEVVIATRKVLVMDTASLKAKAT